MTIELERSTELLPELHDYPQPGTELHGPGRIRKALGALAVVTGGALGAWAALGVAQPSAERTIGPGPVEATVGWGNSVDALGISIGDTRLIGADIDVSIDLSSENVHQSIQRLGPIVETFDDEGNEAAFEAFLSEYDAEIKGLAIELGLETTGVIALGAVAGAWSTLRLLEKAKFRVRPDSHVKRIQHVAAGTVMAVLGAGAGVTYNAYQLNSEDVQKKVIRELEQPFRDYLQTGTSKMAFNLNELSSEARTQIGRWLRITNSLANTDPSAAEDTYIWGVYADPHNLPTVPATLETIGRSGNIDALIGLGDYNNTGADFEISSLQGATIGDTPFIGYDDITSCESWEDNGLTCDQPGPPFPHAALSGNHDPTDMADIFDTLGLEPLHEIPEFHDVPVIALNDACYVDQSCHGDEYRERNAAQGEAYLAELLENNRPLPKIGFFASSEAAKPFYGYLDTIIVGGKHSFSVSEEESSTIVHVGSVGQGFPRTSKQASMLLIQVDDEGGMTDCINISWQTLRRAQPKLEPCLPVG